jgi:hypothetical protein
MERNTANKIVEQPSVVRWNSVFAGTLIGIGAMTVLTRFWLALGWSNITTLPVVNVSSVANNIHTYFAISAAVAALAAGFFAGWLSSYRGWGPGLINGLTAWCLTTVAALAIGAPSVVGFIVGSSFVISVTSLWSTFWGVVIGLGLALAGGALGGAARHPASLFQPKALDVTEYENDEAEGMVIRTRSVDLRNATKARDGQQMKAGLGQA